MRHPTDLVSWKRLDELHPSFGNEPRNMRLGLASDDIIPFKNSKTPYNILPVVLILYNLPPWLCMKKKILFYRCLFLVLNVRGMQLMFLSNLR